MKYFLLLILLLSTSIFAQNSNNQQDPFAMLDDDFTIDGIRKMLKERDKMMKRMFDDMGMGKFFDDDFFNGLHDDMLGNPIPDIGKGIEHRWYNTSKEGILLVTPLNPESEVQINVNPADRQIELSGQIKEEVKNLDGQGNVQSTSVSSSSYKSSLPIPSSLAADKAQMKQVDESIVICFPRNDHPEACEDVPKIIARLSKDKPKMKQDSRKRGVDLKKLREKALERNRLRRQKLKEHRNKRERHLKPLTPEKGDVAI